MAERECIFCGVVAELSKEHILPRWLDDVFGRDVLREGSYALRQDRNVERAHERSWPSEIVANFEKAIVCRGCNGGWMAQLEGQCRSIVEPMIAGNAKQLTSNEQLTIASWAALKAMTHDYFWPSYNITSSTQERHRFRESQAPLANMWVQLAAVDMTGRPVEFVCRRQVVFPTSNDAKEVYTLTLTLGRVVIQIAGGPGRSSQRFTAEYEHVAHSYTIYPPQRPILSWPPRRILTSDELDLLAHPLTPPV